jgi:hypothetical protein
VSIEEHTTPPGEHPNAAAISGLLAIAEFLAEHPEVPEMRVFVYGRADHGRENPREALTRFAETLDCRVAEEVRGNDVAVAADVNDRARVQLSASMGSLGGRQRTPQYDYTPITEPCSACAGEPVQNGEQCPKCEGAATQLHQPAYTTADFERAA